MLIFPAAVRAAAEKEDSVIFYLACGTGLCLLVNVGKWLHGEVNDGSAASAYQSVPGTDRENVVYRDQAGDAGGEACGNKNLRIQPHI